MIYFAGVIIILAGLYMLYDLIRRSMMPKLEATILTITKKYPVYKGKQGPRRCKHAQVSFLYKGEEQEREIVLKSKANVGDKLLLTYNPSKEHGLQNYVPIKEGLIILALLGFGVLVLLACHYFIDILS